MPKPTVKPFRWTAFLASQEFHKTVNRVRQGLRAHGIEAGPDGKYSTQEIARAIFDHDALERRAKEARLQHQIDEAQVARDKVKENKRELIRMSELREWILYLQTVLFQIVRHSKLSEQEKQILIRKLKDAPNEIQRNDTTRPPIGGYHL
jgi:hypothetical protein